MAGRPLRIQACQPPSEVGAFIVSPAPGQGPWPGEPTSGSYICRRIMRGTAITMSTATMTTGPMRTMGGSLR